MKQPSKSEIDDKVAQCIEDIISREEVAEWAYDFIRNDDKIEITDMDTWHYLVALKSIDEMVYPDEYLYSKDDIKGWIK